MAKTETKRFTAKAVCKALGSENLSLYRGNGYWYFVFDDLKNGIYDTRSVMSMYLGDTAKDFEYWLSEGRSFLASVNQRRAA